MTIAEASIRWEAVGKLQSGRVSIGPGTDGTLEWWREWSSIAKRITHSRKRCQNRNHILPKTRMAVHIGSIALEDGGHHPWWMECIKDNRQPPSPVNPVFWTL